MAQNRACTPLSLLSRCSAVALALAACGSSEPGGSETDSGATQTESDASSSESGEESTGEPTSGATAGPTGGMTDSGTSGTSGTTEAPETTEPGTTGPAEPFCGDGNLDPGEECDDGNDDSFDGCLADCTEVETLEPPELEWEYYEIPGTRCMDGSPAGFGVSHNPASSNVMIYLEGGGACFSDACDFMAFSLPFVPPSDGIFSRGNDNNPVKDWTMVYVPYCTGDIHGGDAESELGGQLRQFRGYTNITRYLEILVPSFPAERVLLTGISAGGFGAAINMMQVADAYGDQVELTVIDDSGPPMKNDVIPPCLQNSFIEIWGLDSTVLAECETCEPDTFVEDLTEYALSEYPDIQFGLFSNTADAVISLFMGAGWGNGQYNNCGGIPTPIAPWVYAGGLDELRANYTNEVSSMYVTGIGHTALRVGFNITFADGVSLAEWIADVLDGEITHIGP